MIIIVIFLSKLLQTWTIW